MELQAHAEHQQDDADFRELLGKAAIDDEPGRVRADERAGQQIADNGRQAEAVRDVSEEKRDTQPGGEREDQVITMHGPDKSDRSMATASVRGGSMNSS